jgi:hypothetical protein
MSAVNDLHEAFNNAPNGHRPIAEIGRMLAHDCQGARATGPRQPCPHWLGGQWDGCCSLYEDQEEWVRVMITMGRTCGRQA